MGVVVVWEFETAARCADMYVLQPHQPVEFNHAINYVNKIKVISLLFATISMQPCIALYSPTPSILPYYIVF